MARKSPIQFVILLVGKLRAVLTFAFGAFDICDLLVFGGLFSLGYGFYSLFPWLGWVVFGAVSMLLGLGWIVRRPKA